MMDNLTVARKKVRYYSDTNTGQLQLLSQP